MIAVMFALALAPLGPNVPAPDSGESAALPAYPGTLEDCIQENGPKVEAAIPDLAQAVDYLLLKVCSIPIAEENAKIQRAAQETSALRMQQLCDQQGAANTDSDKPSGAGAPAAVNYCLLAKNLSAALAAQPFRFDPWHSNIAVASAPPAATAMAAKLLLDLRAAHAHRHPGDRGGE